MANRDHLGGYIPGGDPATYYPELWRWLVEEYGVKSMIDIGCGEGHALEFFADLGCSARGIEGTPQDNAAIVQHDFTTGPIPTPRVYAQLVWSCEFVEHVEERYVPNFLWSFASAMDLILMTHAEPGQDGHHHVNCRTADYWKGALAASGFAFDAELTTVTRELAAANENPWNHYRRSGLAFRRHA